MHPACGIFHVITKGGKELNIDSKVGCQLMEELWIYHLHCLSSQYQSTKNSIGPDCFSDIF